MTLTLVIESELERRLKDEAQQRGLADAQCALLLLEESLASAPTTPAAPLDADPLMAMAGADDFEPVAIDEVVYR